MAADITLATASLWVLKDSPLYLDNCSTKQTGTKEKILSRWADVGPNISIRARGGLLIIIRSKVKMVVS